MARFRAIDKGYYNDILYEPETKHTTFEAPDDWCVIDGKFQCSWAERDDTAKPDAKPAVSEDTEDAEGILDREADMKRDDTNENKRSKKKRFSKKPKGAQTR